MSPNATHARNPFELSLHPARRNEPEWPADDPELHALIESIRLRGMDQPITIDPTGRVMDGRRRWMAAKRLQLDGVPVQVAPADEAHEIYLSSLVNRKHLTKSAIAYLAFPHLKPAFEAAHRRHLDCLRKGKNPNVSPSSPLATTEKFPSTVEAMSSLIGVERNLLFEAAKVHKAFESTTKYPFELQGGAMDGATQELTMREYFEPRILRSPIGGEHEQNRPLGLGAVIAGIAGLKHTKGKAKKRPEQLDLFFRSWAKLGTAWRSLQDQDRKQVREHLGDWVSALPDDLMEDLADALLRRRKRGAGDWQS